MENEKVTKPTSGDQITADISNSSGQIAVGKDINQKQIIGSNSQITDEDIHAAMDLFDSLLTNLRTNAPSDKREQAVERVEELRDEFATKEPKLSTVEYVKNWFIKHLPTFAGALVSIFVNPVVGKIVEAGGEIAADEFKKRFGH